MREEKRKIQWAMPIASGLMIALAFPGERFPNLGMSYLMPFALVPLFFALSSTTKSTVTVAARLRRGLLSIWSFGFTLSACAFSWITTPAVLFGGVAPLLAYLGFLIYCALCGVFFAIVFTPFLIDNVVFAKTRQHIPVLILACAATLLEMTVPRFFFWTFGSLMHSVGEVNQWSAWFGFSIGSVFVFASGSYLARLISSEFNFARSSRKIAVWTAAWFAIFFSGLARIKWLSRDNESLEKLRVGFIQPNFTFAELASNPIQGTDAQQQSLETLLQMFSALFAASGARPLDLMVWPESVVPHQFTFSRNQKEKVQMYATDTGVPILLQAVEQTRENNETVIYSVSTVVASSGEFTPFYRKWIPMPFGESIPFEGSFPWLGDFVRNAVGNVSKVGIGHSADPLPFGNKLVGPLICFDAISPELPRLQVSNGASILVNQANFVWMGSSNAGLEFQEIARFRAVENGRSLLLVSNTGPTVAFDHMGRKLTQSTSLLSQSKGVVELPIYKEETLYVRLGNLPLKIVGALSWIAIALKVFFSLSIKDTPFNNIT